ncbi:SsgA family sporulation/cell division regulator [Amycolatopsis sp. CA-128772]|uniref:SsgA family sporulation/cell division regulator n=1 Tax=Amycolatopsis sp. CA-128772 TaxID=2073159 RepID=UPI000CD19CF4|nr:SsgA family sporulation/cell division regulator [Amycolatopsis sp. CA-128772]
MRMELPALIGRGVVAVTARYCTNDPYVITLGFPVAVCEQEWLIGRELLAEGLDTGAAGIGDVRVTARGDVVTLGLSTPDGVGWVVFRRDDVAALVTLTHRLVMPGHEGEFLDWSDTAGFPGEAP